MSARVVVAHETGEIREAALRVVRDAGWQGVGVAEGESARALVMTPPHPAALVVDVGLPGLHAYEICDEIRARGLPTGVVLIASVYSRTAYKRRPTSLYGADDYVEQHHIPDLLGPKLAALVTGRAAGRARDVHAPAGLTPGEREELERIRAAAEGRLAAQGGADGAGGAAAVERARRLARLLAADIVLYNGEEVAAGLRHGDLERRLEADVRAGRELFAARVPPEVAALEDFLGAALRELTAPRPRGKT